MSVILFILILDNSLINASRVINARRHTHRTRQGKSPSFLDYLQPSCILPDKSATSFGANSFTVSTRASKRAVDARRDLVSKSGEGVRLTVTGGGAFVCPPLNEVRRPEHSSADPDQRTANSGTPRPRARLSVPRWLDRAALRRDRPYRRRRPTLACGVVPRVLCHRKKPHAKRVAAASTRAKRKTPW